MLNDFTPGEWLVCCVSFAPLILGYIILIVITFVHTPESDALDEYLGSLFVDRSET